MCMLEKLVHLHEAMQKACCRKGGWMFGCNTLSSSLKSSPISFDWSRFIDGSSPVDRVNVSLDVPSE